MLTRLKRDVCAANLELVRRGLVIETWGNASGIDRERGLVVIKPSGVAYERMKPADMVVVSLATGVAVASRLRPSSDTPTHLELYRAFADVGGIVHTHSPHATAWAQGRREIPVFGTTHADYFNGPVPCTRRLRTREIRDDYELNTGRVIIERFRKLNPLECPGALVPGHGPFAWGATVFDAVHRAGVLEFVARLASETLAIGSSARPIQAALLKRHFSRKHGPSASYGQR